MMARLQFESTLRSHLDRKPFQPFVIDLDTGDHWIVEKRESISFLTGPSAIYIEPDETPHFVDADNVKQIVDLPISAE